MVIKLEGQLRYVYLRRVYEMPLENFVAAAAVKYENCAIAGFEREREKRTSWREPFERSVARSS